MENTDQTNYAHEAGESEVCPGNGLQARRHNKEQTDDRKGKAEHCVINACKRAVNVAKGGDLRGYPAEGNDQGKELLMKA